MHSGVCVHSTKQMAAMVLLVAALVAAEGSPSGRVGGPSGCSAGGKLCCPYNRSVFHSRIVPPAYGGPAPFRLDQHYTIDAVDDVTYSFTSANGTFADTVITVDPPADNCNRVNCTACAACGLPCGGNKADELCAKGCPGACLEKTWGQDLTATFSTDPSGRSNASKPVTLKGHVDGAPVL